MIFFWRKQKIRMWKAVKNTKHEISQDLRRIFVPGSDCWPKGCKWKQENFSKKWRVLAVAIGTVESERMKNCDNKLSASKKLRQNATSEQNKSNKFSMHLKKTDPKLKTIKSPRELSPWIPKWLDKIWYTHLWSMFFTCVTTANSMQNAFSKYFLLLKMIVHHGLIFNCFLNACHNLL